MSTKESETQDIKAIKQVINEMSDEMDSMKRKLETQETKTANMSTSIQDLEKENAELREKVCSLEQKLRYNNLIIFGLKLVGGQNVVENVMAFSKKYLGIELKLTDINDVYTIGKAAPGITVPIVLKVSSYLTKKEMFRNAHKLKNSGISISNGYTAEENQKHKKLYQHYKDAKAKGYFTKITDNKVIINGESYTYEEIVNENPDEDEGMETSSSAKRLRSGEPPNSSRFSNM